MSSHPKSPCHQPQSGGGSASGQQWSFCQDLRWPVVLILQLGTKRPNRPCTLIMHVYFGLSVIAFWGGIVHSGEIVRCVCFFQKRCPWLKGLALAEPPAS